MTRQEQRQRRADLELSRQKLAELESAEFPRDYDKFKNFTFTLQQGTLEGRRVAARWRMKYPNNDCPVEIFLPLLQTDLALAKIRYWTRLTAGLLSVCGENQPGSCG